MNYEITDITNGVATVEYSDGSNTFIQLWSNMTEDDLDHLVYQNAPAYLRGGNQPTFLSGPCQRTAAQKEDTIIIEDKPAWLVGREAAYGPLGQQIEYITEHGLDAWQTKVAQIKADNPKPSE